MPPFVPPGPPFAPPSFAPMSNEIATEDQIAERIDTLSDQRFALDEKLADVTCRLRELTWMEQAVERGDV